MDNIARCSIVSLCALDLSKAFDKMNHHALLIKRMNRQVPINLFEIMEKLFDLSCTCIKRGSHVSMFFKLAAGVRQGRAMSPPVSSQYLLMTLSKC